MCALRYETGADSNASADVNARLANPSAPSRARATVGAAEARPSPPPATEENPECAKEERECPWLAAVYGKYYGGVDTVDMDVNQSRFDHKSNGSCC